MKGDLVFPVQKTATTGQWLSEIGAIQDFTPEWEALRLISHRIGAMTKFTSELLRQTGGGVEDWARREVLGAVASAIDKGALSGNGGVEPLGIANSNVVQTITIGGASTWGTVTNLEYLVSNANAPDDEISFVASPAVRKKWRETPRTTNGSKFLWEDGNIVAGRPAYATENAPGDRIICGAFTHYSIAMFGLVDVLVNPFNELQNGIVRVTVNAFADCGEFYPQSFCVSLDAANQ